MSVDDQSDVWRELREMKRKIARLESGSMLENSSITRGRMRFIGGTLRVDSGGRVEIVGTLDLEGTMTVTDGEIIVDGDNPIRLGSDASGVASIGFGGGFRVLSSGGAILLVSDDGSILGVGGEEILLQADGINVADSLSPLPSGEGYKTVVRSDATGLLHTFTGGTGGGPGDGVFAWPFPLDQVTSEFRPPERPTHDGIDFGIGPSNTQGMPIPSAGSGVVETVGTPNASHGWGNYVLVNHGSDPLYGNAVIQTRYAHMYQAPPVQVGDPVTLGMTLGGIGNTGNSFGNHLHFEVLVDGAYVNPRTFMAAHGG